MNEIDVNEIFQKLRTRIDIKNFFSEQGMHIFILYKLNKKYSLILTRSISIWKSICFKCTKWT